MSCPPIQAVDLVRRLGFVLNIKTKHPFRQSQESALNNRYCITSPMKINYQGFLGCYWDRESVCNLLFYEKIYSDFQLVLSMFTTQFILTCVFCINL